MPQVINFMVSEITGKDNTDVGIEERELEPFHTSKKIKNGVSTSKKVIWLF